MITPEVLLPLAIGIVIGITVGAIVAGIAAMERPWFWVVLVRLPERVHRQIATTAEHNHRSIAREIISRLRNSIETS